MKFKDIVNEIAWKCRDGMPNFKRADDVKLLSKWGWLSLITKTNNKEKAQNQQCHYDYFKEADDQQAWELFQAVLGGTNLILEFLETNVEL